MVWKVYAWVMLLLVLITLAGRAAAHFRRPGSTTNWDLFEAAFNFVLIPGLFGYVYHRACGPRIFWEVTVPLAWLAIVYGLLSPTHRKLAQEKGIRVALLVSLASFALNFPGMLAITLYAYSRPDIWK